MISAPPQHTLLRRGCPAERHHELHETAELIPSMRKIPMVPGANKKHPAEVQTHAQDDRGETHAGHKRQKRNQVHQEKRDRAHPVDALIRRPCVGGGGHALSITPHQETKKSRTCETKGGGTRRRRAQGIGCGNGQPVTIPMLLQVVSPGLTIPPHEHSVGPIILCSTAGSLGLRLDAGVGEEDAEEAAGSRTRSGSGRARSAMKDS